MNSDERFIASWPAVAGTTQSQREIARRLAEHHAQAAARWDHVVNVCAGVAAAVCIGVGGGIALAVWLTGCGTGGLLC